MNKITENTGFRCVRCGASVAAVTNGGFRNHCPVCLYSRHVDIAPGDRANACRAPMAPVGIDYNGKKGFVIIHACTRCGARGRNMAAVDTVQPDDLAAFMARQSA